MSGERMGRPSDFTPELGTEICSKLIEIGSLRKVCAEDGMPSKTSVFRWLAKGDEKGAPGEYRAFRDQYAHARRLAKEYQFDEHWEDIEEAARVAVISDGEVVVGPDGEPVKEVTAQSIAFARLKHDAFKWQSSKEDPKKYGEKVTQEHVGKDGGAIETQDSSVMDIARRMAFILNSAVSAQEKDGAKDKEG
jgi:hypothetical protein